MSKFISDLIDSGAFRLGLALSTVTTVVFAMVIPAMRRPRPVALGGAAFAAVAGFVAWRELRLPPGVALGAVIMVAGAMLGSELWEWLLGVTPGAIMVVRAGSDLGGAAAVASVVGIVVVAALAIDFDRTFRDSAIGLPLLAVSIVGVLITVPDTERAFALFGAAIPLALLGWPFRLASLGPSAAAAVAVVGWVAISAATARPGAAVGALASLGLMIAEPIGRRFSRGARSALSEFAASGWAQSLAVVAIHGALVLGASRIAGLREGAAIATVIAIVVLVPGMILGGARLPAPNATDSPDHSQDSIS